jgi:hypothetical protein
MATDIAKQREEIEDENIMIAGVFAIIAVIVAVVTVQRMVGIVRFPVQTEGIEPIASNSTGAFERMLIGLST